LACPRIQEPPAIGRLAYSAAESVPSEAEADAKREAADLVEEIGDDVVRHQNHVRNVVISPACLRASAAKEAGIIGNLSSRAQRRISPQAAHSVTADHAWSLGEVLRCARDDKIDQNFSALA
jgi:hypothetical protein